MKVETQFRSHLHAQPIGAVSATDFVHIATGI
jgi:hypothetical protein